MTDNEKAAIIGYWRNGATWHEIGLIMGISESYAKLIVKEYLKNKKGEKQKLPFDH
jgi:DNA-directed RNA polymerase specialized sigma subunit